MYILLSCKTAANVANIKSTITQEFLLHLQYKMHHANSSQERVLKTRLRPWTSTHKNECDRELLNTFYLAFLCILSIQLSQVIADFSHKSWICNSNYLFNCIFFFPFSNKLAFHDNAFSGPQIVLRFSVVL